MLKKTHTGQKKRPPVRKIEILIDEPVEGGIVLCIAQALKKYSFKEIRNWIDEDAVKINGSRSVKKKKLKPGDKIIIRLPKHSMDLPTAEDIPLDIIFEDEHLMIINKPSALVVHPAPGTPYHTLVNALLRHTDKLSNINGSQFPGLVHRLDKNTSGLMIIAKTNKVHSIISKNISSRKVKRIYQAICWGTPYPPKGIISVPVGSSYRKGQRYAATRGKPAITKYLVTEKLGPFSILRLSLQTGRTHQIRLHLAHIEHPVVGDKDYCRVRPETALKHPELIKLLNSAGRQMLHAAELHFKHPITNEPMNYEAKTPRDMQKLITALQKNFTHRSEKRRKS
jgi:23S rRNA pseudouridine1911/1915/1917 synthase